MASIREVARLANVSPATVSRVINRTANVDPEKKARVLRAIAETDFVPNEVARSLFKRSARTIGLIVPSIENPFFAQLANAIEKTSEDNGYRMLLCNMDNEVEKEKTMINMLKSMNADGIIITTSNKEVREYIDMCDIPIVITDKRLEKDFSCDYVHCDYHEGGRLAMEHLMECGCRNIVCVKGPQHISSARAHFEGYQQVCRERGITEQVIDCDYDYDEGLVMAEQLLELYPDVDGIIACSDMVAIAVYKILHKRGIMVPEQVQLVGFDNINLASIITPELTTIAQPVEEIGKKAVELIINGKKDNNENNEYIFNARLIKRETTKGR